MKHPSLFEDVTEEWFLSRNLSDDKRAAAWTDVDNNARPEIDPEGTKSNRDSIGARVDARARSVRQVRIQEGGMLARSPFVSQFLGDRRHCSAQK